MSELAAPFDISLQAVSRHIQVLVRAGLVRQERSGRISRCSLDAGPILTAALWLNRYSKYWQQQFDLLAASLLEIEEPPAAPSVAERRTSDDRQSPGCFTRRLDRGAQAVPRQGKGVQPPARRVERASGVPCHGSASTSRTSSKAPTAAKPLADLFAGRSQLVVYHFMLGPTGRKAARAAPSGPTTSTASTSIWRIATSPCWRSRRHRSTGSNAFKQRMGWSFKWVSSAGCDFNHDYHVTFTPEEIAKGDVYYNYAWRKSSVHRTARHQRVLQERRTARSIIPIPPMRAAST